jgi:hypothetical protein
LERSSRFGSLSSATKTVTEDLSKSVTRPPSYYPFCSRRLRTCLPIDCGLREKPLSTLYAGSYRSH